MFLINCYESLSKNKRSLTKGIDDTTAELMTKEQIEKIANQIKEIHSNSLQQDAY